MSLIDDGVVRRVELELSSPASEIGAEAEELSETKLPPAITDSTANIQIIKVLNVAIQASYLEFQMLYSRAEQALIAKLITLLVMTVAIYAIIILFQLLFFLTESGIGPDAAGIGIVLLFYPVIIIVFVLRVINLASTFLAIRRIRMLKEANAFDLQLAQGKAIMKDLKERARTIRVGDNSIFIGGDNAGSLNTGSMITIHQGSEAADVLALLLTYTKDNAVASEHAKQIALEMAKPKPDKGLVFSAWTAIVALLPHVKDVVDIASGMAKLLGLNI